MLDSSASIRPRIQHMAPPRRETTVTDSPTRSGSSSSTTIRVVRMGLQMFFDLQADIEVVGEADDGSEGVAMARRLEPDVVLMDLLMPNLDGVTRHRPDQGGAARRSRS